MLDVSDTRANEQVPIWKFNNGERFITCALEAIRGCSIISLNGSEARRASVGDLVIIAAFGMVHDDKRNEVVPKLVFPDDSNRIREMRCTLVGPQAGDPIHPR